MNNTFISLNLEPASTIPLTMLLSKLPC